MPRKKVGNGRIEVGKPYKNFAKIIKVRQDRRGVSYKCRCLCGKIKWIAKSRLTDIRSCGCNRTIHGIGIVTRFLGEYGSWKCMKSRCLSKNNKAWLRYGGRGISICDRWLEEDKGFTNFLRDMGSKPTPKHQLDRIKNNEDYTPDNCRWTTSKKNNRNRSNNRKIRYKGKTRTLVYWSDFTGIGLTTLVYRIQKGWGAEKALETPVRAFSQSLSLKQESRDYARKQRRLKKRGKKNGNE